MHMGKFARPVLFVAVMFSVLFLPYIVFADTASDVATTAGYSTTQSLLGTIGTIISVVLGLLGVIFLILLIYSGWVWMTAGGEEEKINKAKRILINAVVGLVITLSAYAIASFLLNAIGDATTNSGGSTNGSVTTEALSGSLGSGSIQDHYPSRNATGIARNTRIMVTFKRAMDPASFIEGYNADNTATTINASNVAIYPTAEGEGAAITAADVYFTEDMKTVVFDPTDYLGSADADTSYTVSLDTDIAYANGDDAFTGSYSGGYEWSFEVSTVVDLDPPTVTGIAPSASGTYDRNITVELTFNEAIDPTSATGTRTATSGFQNIQTVGDAGTAEAGTYEISNSYRTVTFTTANACGTNSCGETIYCLPGLQTITVTAYAATTTNSPPQADSFPYDGITDTAANSMDGNDDGTAGDDYTWTFSTTDDINLTGPTIESISPNILEEGVALDQSVVVTFDSVMKTSSLTNANITMENDETSTNTSHEMWYTVGNVNLQADGTTVTSPSQTAAQTEATISHGVFLESIDGLTYLYGVAVGQGVRNEYQNCYSPAEGPTVSGGTCAVGDTSPSCCNGDPSAAACDFFSPTNE